MEKIPGEELYSYPEFTRGTVYLRNEGFSVALMNYNSLFAEMQFIDTKGDTLSLGDEKNIKLIVINTDTFYYNDGYLKLIAGQGEVKLANKKFITFLNREKSNGFGLSSAGGIETFSSMESRSYLKELVVAETLTLAMNSVFYIGDKFNYFKVVNKKSLMDVYASKEKELQDYLKENKVNFSNEEDLKKLIAHFKTEK